MVRSRPNENLTSISVSIHSQYKLYIEMGDASKNPNNLAPIFFKRNDKRPRTQLEREDTAGETHQSASENSDNNETPTASLTDLSEGGLSDGLSTTGSTAGMPSLSLNGVHLSTDTVITSTQLNREKKHLAFKLDKLHDKVARYESHVTFLTKCLDNNVTPNGLRVYVEPSIGNRDDDFLHSWHEHLNEFSRTLTRSVIEYSEKTVASTKLEISEISEKLKALISEPAFTEIKNALTRNDNTRSNELTSRKNRKFYKLKYGERERERDREPERNGPPSRTQNGTVILSNRGHRGMNRPSDSDLETRPDDARANGNHRNEERRNQSEVNRRETRGDRHTRNNEDDNARVLSVINNRNQNYADATRNQVSTNRDQPLHERISLNRRNSRNNLRQERGPREDQYSNPREGNGPREDPQRHANDIPREGHSRHNGARSRATEDRPREGQGRYDRETRPREDLNRHDDERDILIQSLHQRIEGLERNRMEPQQGTSILSEDTHQKNGQGAQQHQGPRAKTLEEMQTYLAEAMATISEFAKQLSEPIVSKQIHLDK